MKRLQNRLGLNEIDLPDERKPSEVRVPEEAPESEEKLEEATVGAGAPVPPLPHDPTHPAAEGSAERVDEAARLASMPSLADTVPMPNVDADGDGDGDGTAVSPETDRDARAPTPSTEGDESDASTAIPVRRQQNPDAT
jgi:hypothetical protein